MSVWNDLEAAARKLADDVTTEVSVAAREQRLKEAYQTLGKLHYQAITAGKAPEGAQFDKQLQKITALRQQIEDLRRSKHVTADDSDFA